MIGEQPAVTDDGIVGPEAVISFAGTVAGRFPKLPVAAAPSEGELPDALAQRGLGDFAGFRDHSSIRSQTLDWSSSGMPWRDSTRSPRVFSSWDGQAMRKVQSLSGEVVYLLVRDNLPGPGGVAAPAGPAAVAADLGTRFDLLDANLPADIRETLGEHLQHLDPLFHRSRRLRHP